MKRDVRWAIWQMLVYGFLAALMIAAPATGWADQSDERLEELFGQLRTTADSLEAQIIEVQIWQIWTDSRRDDINALVAEGSCSMVQGLLKEAIAIFDRVVTTLPDYLKYSR
jgi:hypothetical protein